MDMADENAPVDNGQTPYQPVVVHVHDEDDENENEGGFSFPIILLLIAVILIVLFFMGRSLSGWFGTVTEGASDAVGNFYNTGRGILGTGSTTTIDDEILEEMFMLNRFIITASNTEKNYLASITRRSSNIAVYDVNEVGEAESTTQIVLGRNIPGLTIPSAAEKINIPSQAMSRLERIRVGQTLTLEGNTYKAEIYAEGKPDNIHASYKLTVQRKT